MLIDTLARHKETLLREHREQEESRRLAVDYAVKVGWAEDRLAIAVELCRTCWHVTPSTGTSSRSSWRRR